MLSSRWFIALFLLTFFIPATANAARRPPASSIVVNAKTGEVLSSQNADTPHHPASLTKLMTLYITFEALEKGIIKMDDLLPVSQNAANRSPSRLGVKPGDKLKVSTAIDALIIKSANDCATVLAEGLGYSEPKFAEKMTEVAKALGMKNTVFKNASGLPNRRQITTARDMATLAAAVYYHFPQYYDLFSRTQFSYDGKTYYTHNHLLKSFEGADGMKTGYIASAGYNIVTSAQRDGERVIAVTLGHNTLKERDRAAARLMEQAFGKLALNDADAATPVFAKLENNDFKLAELTKEETSAASENAVSARQAPADAIWAVQVGAFSNYAKARVYALKIRRQFPQFKDRSIAVEPAQTASSIIYRSKLVGFDKKDAGEICKNLQKSNKSCIVVPIKTDSQLTLAVK